MIDLFYPALPPITHTVRVVRALDEPPTLTARQLANQKYRASAKGQAAAARALAKQRANPAWRANNVARVNRWRDIPINRLHTNVLRRVQRRHQKIASTQGQQ